MPRLTLLALTGLVALTAEAAPWSLEAVLARAREAAPEVRLAASAVAEAEAGKVGQAVPFPVNPRLFADYRPLAIELEGQPVDPRHGYNLGVDGLFEVGGAGRARVDEAERRVAVAEMELRAAREAAAARAWVAWSEAQLAQQRSARLDQELALLARVEHAASERVAAGVAGEAEVSAVRVDVAGVKGHRLEAERRRRTAIAELMHLLDLDAAQPFETAPANLDLPDPPAEATLVARALELRPELAVARARLAVLEATDARLVREAVPKLGYNLGLDAAPASPVFAFIGMSVELPVAQKNQGPRAVAAAQHDTERARLELLSRRIGREVAAALRSYSGRRARVELLLDEALPAARRTQALVEEGWLAGRFDVFRLTTATRDVLRLEQEFVEAALAAWSDYVDLQRLSGALSP